MSADSFWSFDEVEKEKSLEEGRNKPLTKQCPQPWIALWKARFLSLPSLPPCRKYQGSHLLQGLDVCNILVTVEGRAWNVKWSEFTWKESLPPPSKKWQDTANFSSPLSKHCWDQSPERIAADYSGIWSIQIKTVKSIQGQSGWFTSPTSQTHAQSNPPNSPSKRVTESGSLKLIK